VKKKFDDLVWEEAISFGREKIKLYLRYGEYRRKLQKGEPCEEMNKPPAVDLIMALYNLTTAHGVDEGEEIAKINEFFTTKSVLKVPSIRISSEYFASIARKFSGAKKNPSKGMINDSIALSTFLPYCDVIFTDIENDLLFQAEPLKGEKLKYGTEVFSYRTIEDFIGYLDQILISANKDHISLVNDIYDTDWLDSKVINFDEGSTFQDDEVSA